MSLVTKLGTKLEVTKLLLNFTKLVFGKVNYFKWLIGLVVTKQEVFSYTPPMGVLNTKLLTIS